MTVTAPDIAAPLGTPIMIKGTVTDISAGTTQANQAARFPSGVPAVSDASQREWMEYVYMQKPRPTNATGVPVTVSVVDVNGNYRQIGNTISDEDGRFSLPWTPDIAGQYVVYASFAGSESYWPSHAENSFVVQEAQVTPTPQSQIALPSTEMYFAISTAAIIMAIAIVGAILVLILRKRP
jgi:hypothetical protein